MPSTTATNPGKDKGSESSPKKSRSPGDKKKKSDKGDKVEAVAGPYYNRPALSENYESHLSGRESWWRSTIRETPVPGAYEQPDFIDELQRKTNSYRFKSDGRRLDPQPQIGKGKLLMPGAYEYEDFVKRNDKFQKSYSFKNTSRAGKDFLNFGKKDKDVNVPPNNYEIQNYLTLTVEKQPSKHWQFKSQSQRFPTIYFKPKNGPPPGGYEYKSPNPAHSVSSSFKSKTPRFNSSHTKVPGPGSYAKTYRPMTTTVTKMGRQYGLFFSPQFQTCV